MVPLVLTQEGIFFCKLGSLGRESESSFGWLAPLSLELELLFVEAEVRQRGSEFQSKLHAVSTL